MNNGNETWRRQLGTPADEVLHAGRHLVLDGRGHVLVAGTTWGAMDDDTPNAGGADAFVVKLRLSDGAEAWRRQIGTAEDDRGRALAVDGDGYVFLVGGTDGAIDPGFRGDGPSAFAIKMRP
jgi:outer membrane protein assembly factor BamB